MIHLDGPPARWIVKGGRPADAVWKSHNGIPSFESGEDGSLLVYELVAVTEMRGLRTLHGVASADATSMIVPRHYQEVAFRSAVVGDHELVALYDDPDAVWSWRPLVYQLRQDGLVRLGSQQELEWRWGLAEVYEAQIEQAGRLDDLMHGLVDDKVPWEDAEPRLRALVAEMLDAWQSPREEANRRADALLLEHLCPQQRIELASWGHFHVRGTINALYRIEPGNGASIVSPQTRRQFASMCLHPERWMPHADVALATKLAIESGPDGEEEMLAGARTTWRGPGRGSTSLERAAWERERDLLPRPVPRPLGRVS